MESSRYKFRAWDKIEGKMWTPAVYMGVLYAASPFGTFVRMDGELSDPLMQYTGLKDKNGVEIYEGDFINSILPESKHPGLWEVCWSDYSMFMVRRAGENQFKLQLGWLLENNLGNHKPRDGVWGSVIGNIYENPELLENA